MPPANDPIRFQILEAMRSAWEALSSTDYFYPPNDVAPIVPPLFEYLKDRPVSLETVYGYWVEDEDRLERTAGRLDKQMRLFLQVATRYDPDRTDPFEQYAAGVDFEEEFRSKQVHDVEKLVDTNMLSSLGGNKLGGLIENWEVLGNDAFQATSVRIPGWVATEFEMLVTYFNKPGDPTTQ